MAAAVLLMVGCSDSGSTPSIIGGASSVVPAASSTVPLSSGVAPSSSTSVVDTTSGDNIGQDTQLAAPTGVAVSRWASLGTLILKWDPPTYDPATVTGIVIERDSNYTGWKAIATITGDSIRNGLYTDNGLSPTTEMKYRYRLYTLKVDSVSGAAKRSAFSDVVGTMALDVMGFGATGFDLPANFTGCWWNLRDLEIRWGVLKMSQENGWVVQGLTSDNNVDTIPAGLNNAGPIDVSRAVWTNLDTLKQDNNHFWVYESPISIFRIYSYFLGSFSQVTSEFSPELGLSNKCKNLCKDDWNCSPPTAVELDTATHIMSWKPPTQLFDCQQVMANNGGSLGYYPSATCSGASGCTDIDMPDGTKAPCWIMAKTTELAPNPIPLPFSFVVRGVALNAAGDRYWESTAWSDPAGNF